MYTGLTLSSYRLILKRPYQLWHRKQSTHLLHRSISCSQSQNNWRNETPPGGLTEILVYTPESQVAWPDSTLGIFAQADPRFVLPGNVGLTAFEEEEVITEAQNDSANESKSAANSSYIPPRIKVDVLEVKTSREHQAQTLYSANDFIQYTRGVETYVCSNPVILEKFPALTAAFNMAETCKFELHDAPQLLKKEVKPLFPGVSAFSNPDNSISVITMVQETANDMSTWSDQVESERETLTEQFVGLAKEVCGRLKSDGYWADFIDPSAGVPYFGRHTNTTMFETDEKYRLLGFRIEDLGCCKVICHKEFGRKVFVGTIFTSVASNTGTIQDVFVDLNILHLKEFSAQAITSKSPDLKAGEIQSDLFNGSLFSSRH